MYKRLPPLNSLKAFECAARHLSFTKAADELFVTQAAVSHQIKLLEDFLGIELFRRQHRALVLTELGQVYFNDVTDILHRLSGVTQQLLAKKNDKHLAISVPQTFGIQWLVPRLTYFNQLYPDIEVRLTGVDQDEGLLNREIDIAIYYGRGDWEGLQVEKLAEENLLLLASSKLLDNKAISSPEDLKKHTLIHIHTRDNWQNMANYLGLKGLDIQHGPIFSHTFMALQAAIHGQGVVLANRILAQQEIDRGTLQIVLPIQLKDPKSFYVVNRLDKANHEQILAFRQWIFKEIRNNHE